MSKGTDRDIVNSWISDLNLISALLDDLNHNLYWPVITSVSQDQTVAVGDTCTFFVEATNVTSYQWQYITQDGWTDIPGETGTSYSFTVTESSYDDLFRCRMVGKIPEAVSSTDMLAVLPPSE